MDYIFRQKSAAQRLFEEMHFKANKLKYLKYEDVVLYFYQPTDPSSLGIIRFLFGLLMSIDVIEERGGADIDLRYGNPKTCHFPLFSIVQPLPYHYMTLVYAVMWIGAVGIMLGLKFSLSVMLYGIPYWYLILLDKSFWNNHSYLFGIITILLAGSSANHFFSLDSLFDSRIRNAHVPYWNYFILKYQFFMLYFLAGLKKSDLEWLEGYSMTNLGEHWVFSPFKLILSTEVIDYLIVHWLGFLLDLTVGFWMLLEFSRPIAMVFCSMFHLMNSRLFSIGMFPYVCLVTMPLFCKEDWPKSMFSFLFWWSEPVRSDICLYREQIRDTGKEKSKSTSEINGEKNQSKPNDNIEDILEENERTEENKMSIEDLKKNEHNKKDKDILDIKRINPKKNGKADASKITVRHKLATSLLLVHCFLQIFLPYSHFITKGYNNWTNGLYGYSWDMMVHSWDTVLVVVKVVDNTSGKQSFIDSHAWTLNDRWNKHGDMCLQYAECIKKNLRAGSEETNGISGSFSSNISIYIDVWCSLNKRFQQRMFNPNYDLMKANWSVFRPIEWLMPVLSEYNGFRKRMNQITEEVYAWSNDSEVMFVADFPGLYLENYIGGDVRNVTLTVLEGEIIYEVEDTESDQSLGVKLKKGDYAPIIEGAYHKIHTISTSPSCYMYTFQKISHNDIDEGNGIVEKAMYSPFPVFEDFSKRKIRFFKMWKDVFGSLLHILF